MAYQVTESWIVTHASQGTMFDPSTGNKTRTSTVTLTRKQSGNGIPMPGAAHTLQLTEEQAIRDFEAGTEVQVTFTPAANRGADSSTE